MDALNPLTGQDLPRGPGVDPGGAHHVHAHVRQVPAPVAPSCPAACRPPSPRRRSTSTTPSWARSSTGARSSAASGTTWCDFFLEANPAYEQVGARPTNLAQTGIWDNSEVYDATYANCNQWGNERWATPVGDHRGQAGHHQPDRHQHRHGGVHRALLLRRLDQDRPPALQHRPPGQPPVALPPVEQDHPAQAHGHQLQGALHLGHRAPLGPPGRRDRRLRPAVGHRPPRRLHREPLLRAHRRRPAHAAPPPRPARDRAVLAAAPHPVRPGAQPGPGLLHGLHRHHRHELPAQGLRVLAPGRDQGPHPVQDPP